MRWLGAHRTVWYLPRCEQLGEHGELSRNHSTGFLPGSPITRRPPAAGVTLSCYISATLAWPRPGSGRDASLTPLPGDPLQAEFRLRLNPPSASGCAPLCQPFLLQASHFRAQGLAVEAAFSGSTTASDVFKLKQDSLAQGHDQFCFQELT